MTPDIIIVGGGPAGIGAALWTKRLGLEPLLVEAGPRLGGQLLHAHNILTDCPGFFGLTGPQIAERLAEHIAAMKVETRLSSPATRIDAQSKSVEIGGEVVAAKALILTLGVRKRRLGVPGEREFEGRGVGVSATRESPDLAGRRVVVVGGGDGAFEEALILQRAGCLVTVLHRSNRFRARPMYRDPVLTHPDIQVVPFATVNRIVGDERVSGIELTVSPPSEIPYVLTLPASHVFLTLGVTPATDLLVGQLELDAEGYVRTSRHGAASAAGVWAAGEACRPLLPCLSTSLGDGATAAKAAFDWLRQSDPIGNSPV